MSAMLHTEDGAGRRHRVVVIGSGFGGLTAAKALRNAPVDVTMIARTQHHLFQPLLYQVATGILAASGMQSDSSKRVRGTRSKCVRLVTWVRADDWYASHPCSVVEELAIVDTSVSFVSPCAAST